MKAWGVIVAAGLGKRMGTPKAFLSLAGKPLLSYSISAFDQSSRIDGIGIVCREQDLDEVKRLAKEISRTKVRFVVEGGKERQDSVLAGVSSLPPDAEMVAVHDAARPLITVDLIDAVIAKAQESGAALAAVPTQDTTKFSENGKVRQTLNRETLWLAQTPQVFRVKILTEALQKARDDRFYGTDCSSLVERLSIPVCLVQGSPENIKITTPADIFIAEAILKSRQSVGKHGS